jgi:hypothetical protein
VSREYTTVVGSGQIPHLQGYPTHQFTPGTFPVPCKSDPRTRTGEGAVVLNPEDFSINISLRSQAITVTTSATPLPANPLENRRALVVHNNSNSTVYLGQAGVTISNGLPLLASEKIAFDIQGNPNVVVYAVGSSSVEVRIMELA